MYLPCADTAVCEPESSVTFYINERVNRVVMWMNNSFRAVAGCLGSIGQLAAWLQQPYCCMWLMATMLVVCAWDAVVCKAGANTAVNKPNCNDRWVRYYRGYRFAKLLMCHQRVRGDRDRHARVIDVCCWAALAAHPVRALRHRVAECVVHIAAG